MQFIDLAAQQARIRDRIDRRIATVLEHGAYIMGPEVAELEAALAEFSGARHCLGCANGTDALLLALMALGAGPGDAVFVPSFTFAATAEVVPPTGATPVLVDIDPVSFNIDPESLRRAIAHARELGLRAAIVIPVDLFGLPADYAAIGEIARAEGMRIIADAAQSFGGALGNRKVGVFGDITTTSFFPAKPLGCYGDGGALFTDDANLATLIDSLRVHGKGTEKYDNVRIGVNSRLDTLQAAILLEKLAILPDEIEARQKVADAYSAVLGDIATVPQVPANAQSAWAQYTLRLPEGRDRTDVMARLKAADVPSTIYYPRPLHRQTAYARFPADPEGLPAAEAAAARVLSLPMHPYLAPADIERITTAVREAVPAARTIAPTPPSATISQVDKPLRIAVMVHNDVIRDARVRKEVRTLTNAGHVVDVYGFRRTDTAYPDTIEGARELILVDDVLTQIRRNSGLQLVWTLAFSLVLLGSTLLFLGVLSASPFGNLTTVLIIWAIATLITFLAGGPRALMRKLFNNPIATQARAWLRRRNLTAWRFRQMSEALAQSVPPEDYDVIHAHDMIALMAGHRLKATNSQLKLVWDAHELYEALDYRDAGMGDFVSARIKATSPAIDDFVTISESFAEYYAREHALPPAKVVMNATRDAGSPHNDGRLHRAARLNPSQRILLFQGGLSPHRGITALLEASKHLPADWSLVFMGWGPLQEEVERARDRLAGRTPGREAICLIPPAPQEELPLWSAGASLGAIPYENVNLNHLYCTPNKLWEYPNAGVPILATDLEEMGRMIRKWDTGLLLPREFGAADILDALKRFDTETERRLRENCARFSCEMSWTRFEPALLSVYDDLS